MDFVHVESPVLGVVVRSPHVDDHVVVAVAIVVAFDGFEGPGVVVAVFVAVRAVQAQAVLGDGGVVVAAATDSHVHVGNLVVREFAIDLERAIRGNDEVAGGGAVSRDTVGFVTVDGEEVEGHRSGGVDGGGHAICVRVRVCIRVAISVGVGVAVDVGVRVGVGFVVGVSPAVAPSDGEGQGEDEEEEIPCVHGHLGPAVGGVQEKMGWSDSDLYVVEKTFGPARGGPSNTSWSYFQENVKYIIKLVVSCG